MKLDQYVFQGIVMPNVPKLVKSDSYINERSNIVWYRMHGLFMKWLWSLNKTWNIPEI